MKDKRLFKITLTGVMAALFCITGPVAIPIPISPVPLSLMYFMIFISAYLLETKLCVFAVIVYILLGAVGLPVFTGFMGGVGKLFGPTGGYIVGYIFLAVISSIFIKKSNGKVLLSVVGMILGALVCYAFGTVWFILQQGASPIAALMMCVVPYLPGDALKIAAAAALGPVLKRAVNSAEAG